MTLLARARRVLRRRPRGERGFAIVWSLVLLVMLTSLMMAFVVLAQTEPVIAQNHARSATARALAESGVELAVWALTHPSTGGIAVPAAGQTAASPWNGAVVIPLGSRGGGVFVAVTGVSATEVTVTTAGWLPASGTGPARVHRRVAVTLTTFPDLGSRIPCALCVNGPLTLQNKSLIDARSSFGSACGGKFGAYSAGATTIRKGSDVYGGDGGSTQNTANKSGIDYAEHQLTFDFALTEAHLATLRSVASARGRYYRGAVTFGTANPLPDSGLVFVDTTDGGPVSPATPVASLASVTLGAGSRPASSPFRGWLIVNGNVTVQAGFGTLAGLLYASNHLTLANFTSTDRLTGAVVAEERRQEAGAGLTAVDGQVVYDCAAVRGDAIVPGGWSLQPGSYREIAG